MTPELRQMILDHDFLVAQVAELKARAAAAEAENERLMSIISNEDHAKDCSWWWGGGSGCSCSRAAADEQEGETRPTP